MPRDGAAANPFIRQRRPSGQEAAGERRLQLAAPAPGGHGVGSTAGTNMQAGEIIDLTEDTAEEQTVKGDEVEDEFLLAGVLIAELNVKLRTAAEALTETSTAWASPTHYKQALNELARTFTRDLKPLMCELAHVSSRARRKPDGAELVRRIRSDAMQHHLINPVGDYQNCSVPGYALLATLGAHVVANLLIFSCTKDVEPAPLIFCELRQPLYAMHCCWEASGIDDGLVVLSQRLGKGHEGNGCMERALGYMSNFVAWLENNAKVKDWNPLLRQYVSDAIVSTQDCRHLFKLRIRLGLSPEPPLDTSIVFCAVNESDTAPGKTKKRKRNQEEAFTETQPSRAAAALSKGSAREKADMIYGAAHAQQDDGDEPTPPPVSKKLLRRQKKRLKAERLQAQNLELQRSNDGSGSEPPVDPSADSEEATPANGPPVEANGGPVTTKAARDLPAGECDVATKASKQKKKRQNTVPGKACQGEGAAEAECSDEDLSNKRPGDRSAKRLKAIASPEQQEEGSQTAMTEGGPATTGDEHNRPLASKKTKKRHKKHQQKKEELSQEAAVIHSEDGNCDELGDELPAEAIAKFPQPKAAVGQRDTDAVAGDTDNLLRDAGDRAASSMKTKKQNKTEKQLQQERRMMEKLERLERLEKLEELEKQGKQRKLQKQEELGKLNKQGKVQKQAELDKPEKLQKQEELTKLGKLGKLNKQGKVQKQAELDKPGKQGKLSQEAGEPQTEGAFEGLARNLAVDTAGGKESDPVANEVTEANPGGNCDPPAACKKTKKRRKKLLLQETDELSQKPDVAQADGGYCEGMADELHVAVAADHADRDSPPVMAENEQFTQGDECRPAKVKKKKLKQEKTKKELEAVAPVEGKEPRTGTPAALEEGVLEEASADRHAGGSQPLTAESGRPAASSKKTKKQKKGRQQGLEKAAKEAVETPAQRKCEGLADDQADEAGADPVDPRAALEQQELDPAPLMASDSPRCLEDQCDAAAACAGTKKKKKIKKKREKEMEKLSQEEVGARPGRACPALAGALSVEAAADPVDPIAAPEEQEICGSPLLADGNNLSPSGECAGVISTKKSKKKKKQHKLKKEPETLNQEAGDAHLQGDCEDLADDLDVETAAVTVESEAVLEQQAMDGSPALAEGSRPSPWGECDHGPVCTRPQMREKRQQGAEKLMDAARAVHPEGNCEDLAIEMAVGTAGGYRGPGRTAFEREEMSYTPTVFEGRDHRPRDECEDPTPSKETSMQDKQKQKEHGQEQEAGALHAERAALAGDLVVEKAVSPANHGAGLQQAMGSLPVVTEGNNLSPEPNPTVPSIRMKKQQQEHCKQETEGPSQETGAAETERSGEGLANNLSLETASADTGAAMAAAPQETGRARVAARELPSVPKHVVTAMVDKYVKRLAQQQQQPRMVPKRTHSSLTGCQSPDANCAVDTTLSVTPRQASCRKRVYGVLELVPTSHSQRANPLQLLQPEAQTLGAKHSAYRASLAEADVKPRAEKGAAVPEPQLHEEGSNGIEISQEDKDKVVQGLLSPPSGWQPGMSSLNVVDRISSTVGRNATAHSLAPPSLTQNYQQPVRPPTSQPVYCPPRLPEQMGPGDTSAARGACQDRNGTQRAMLRSDAINTMKLLRHAASGHVLVLGLGGSFCNSESQLRRTSTLPFESQLQSFIDQLQSTADSYGVGHETSAGGASNGITTTTADERRLVGREPTNATGIAEAAKSVQPSGIIAILSDAFEDGLAGLARISRASNPAPAVVVVQPSKVVREQFSHFNSNAAPCFARAYFESRMGRLEYTGSAELQGLKDGDSETGAHFAAYGLQIRS